MVRRVLGLGLLMLLPAGVPAHGQVTPAGVQLRDVSVTTQSDAVTVTVKTSGEVKYEAQFIDGPHRLVLDFEDTRYAWRKTPLNVSAEPLRQIRGSQYRKNVARVVVELSRKVGFAIREDVDGLVIVIPTAGIAQTTATPPVKATAAKPPVTTVAAPRSVETPAAPVAAPPMPASAPAPAQVAQAQAPPPTAAPVTPPPAPAPALTNGRLISLDFKDADVVNLLRILAAESGKNIVIGDDVKGKMSIALRNVPWELALETILESRGLVKLDRDSVIRIVSSEQLAREREARARVEEAKVKSETDIRTKIAEAQLKEQEAHARKYAADLAAAEQAARGPLREETIRLSYADPEDIANTLQGILGIPAGGMAAAPAVPPPGAGPIPEPPFSGLFGPGPPPPPPPALPSAEVLAKGITIRAHRPTNSIFIRHYEQDLIRIRRLITEKLDIPLPQVKIEARMEILAREDLFAIGVQWGGGGAARLATRTQGESTLVGQGFSSRTGLGIGAVNATGPDANPNLALTGLLPVSGVTGLPQGGNIVNLPITSLFGATGIGGIAFGIIGQRLNLNLALEAMRADGKTRSLARPEIVTVENSKAVMSLGEEIPYATVSSAGTQIQFKEAVLKLEVTPTVIREGNINRIKMKVNVENNSRGTTVDFGGAGNPPAINKRKAETEVLVKEGDSLVIGGVTNNENVEQVNKVPLFGDIPVLGWLFKQRGERNRSTELVVFITPVVLRHELPAAAAAPASSPRQ